MTKSLDENKIERLWSWFVANEHQVIDAFRNEALADYVVENLNNLILDLGKFTWEIGVGRVKPWFLTISPNGDRDLLKASQNIIELAPHLGSWEFNSGKPAIDWDRKFTIYDCHMDEQHIDASNWKFLAVPQESGMIELIIEAKNIPHLDEETAGSAAELVVVSEIGEELKIRKILSVAMVKAIEGKYNSGMTGIQHLRDHLNGL